MKALQLVALGVSTWVVLTSMFVVFWGVYGLVLGSKYELSVPWCLWSGSCHSWNLRIEFSKDADAVAGFWAWILGRPRTCPALNCSFFQRPCLLLLGWAAHLSFWAQWWIWICTSQVPSSAGRYQPMRFMLMDTGLVKSWMTFIIGGCISAHFVKIGVLYNANRIWRFIFSTCQCQ